MTLFLVFVISALVSMALVPPLMNAANRWRVVDVPDERKIHVRAIPRVGGAAMIVGAILPIIAWAVPEPRVIGVLVGMGIIFLFGIWDDWRNLDFRLKFIGQLVAVAVVVGYGGVCIRYLPLFGDVVVPTYIALPATVFVLLGVTNAINLSDGLDGLAAGTTLMSLGVIAVLAYLGGQPTVLLMATAVIGSIVGFIRFNTYPASVFMGDGGSQFLGFTVGVLSLLLTQEPSAMYSYALPLLILALPILDTATVIAQRLYERRSPFRPDKNHIHHRLLALGLDHHEAVLVLYVLQALLFISAYLLRYENDLIVLVFFVLFCAVVLGSLYWASTRGWRLRQRSMAVGVEHASARRWRKIESLVFRTMLILVKLATGIYLVGGAWISSEVPNDVALLAGVMLLLLIGAAFHQHGKPLSWVERVVVYVNVCIVVYFVQVNIVAHVAGGHTYANVFFIGLAVALIVALRYSKDKKFEPTTLDFLVLFIAIVVPNLPGLRLLDAGITETMARAIVLLYSVELVLAHRSYMWNAARGTACASLAVVGFHAVQRMV